MTRITVQAQLKDYDYDYSIEDEQQIKLCPSCHGSGIDENSIMKRYTSGGHDEEPPCMRCNGTGEI